MKLLTIRLTQEQYAQIKLAQQAQLPRVSLQQWVSHALVSHALVSHALVSKAESPKQ